MYEHRDETPIGTVVQQLRYKSPSGREYVPIFFAPKAKGGKVGHPFDDSMLRQLKYSLLAESWVTMEALVGYDIRPLCPHLYSESKCSEPDTREIADRRADAISCVVQVHQKWGTHWKDLCGIDVGFTEDQILRRGPDAARTQYQKLNLREFNSFLRKQKIDYARDAMPGEIDATYAMHQLNKIRALITAVAKCTEFLGWIKEVADRNRPGRGRPPKAPKATLAASETLQLDSKIDFIDPEDVYFIAAYSGINPARLWTNLDDVFEILEHVVIQGKGSRNEPWTKSEQEFIRHKVNPFMLGRRLPRTANERKICQMIGWQLQACENTARRLNLPWSFGDPGSKQSSFG